MNSSDAHLLESSPTLILLTNNFPFAGGDSVFVGNEIDSLARAFERVLVFSYGSGTLDPTQVLPENVVFMGRLRGSGGLWNLLRTFRPRHILPLLRMVIDEFRTRGNAPMLQRLLRACVISLAGGEQIAGAMSQLPSTTPVVLYSFWAAECGYVVADARIDRALVVTRFHRYDLYEERSKYLPLRKAIIENSNILATISQSGASYLTAKYSTWVGHKVETHRLGTFDHGIGPWRDNHDQLIRIVSCSSMIPVKRVAMIFQVIAGLRLGRPVEWVHFGDGPERELLDNEIRSAAHANIVSRMRGYVSNRELMEYYRSTPVDVFVNLSESEGVPVSIMEAMSFDIPVLATAVGGTPEIVSPDRRSGELVSVDAAVDEVSLTLASLISNRATYRARDTWQSMASAPANTATLIESIHEHLHSECP